MNTLFTWVSLGKFHRAEKSQRITSQDKAPTQAYLVQIKNQLDLQQIANKSATEGAI